MRFCDALIPKVEAARQRDGKYPAAIDPAWIEGRKLPAFLAKGEYYEARGEMYRFYFRNPADFMGDVWAYQCGRSQTCDWENYD